MNEGITVGALFSLYHSRSEVCYTTSGDAITEAPESNQRSHLVMFKLAIIVLSFWF